MPVKITLEGRSFLTDDLTLAEAEQIERVTGVSWLHMNPLVSAEHCAAIMTAFLARDIGEDAARAKVGALSVKTAIAACEVVPEDLPDTYVDGVPDPNAGGEPTTT